MQHHLNLASESVGLIQNLHYPIGCTCTTSATAKDGEVQQQW